MCLLEVVDKICCLRPTCIRLHNPKLFKQNGRLLNVETGSHELAILSYATVRLHPSVSLNNGKICREFSEHKIAICENTAGPRSGNSSDLNSARLKVLVPVEIFQFSDMHYETERYRDSTDGLRNINAFQSELERCMSALEHFKVRLPFYNTHTLCFSVLGIKPRDQGSTVESL